MWIWRLLNAVVEQHSEEGKYIPQHSPCSPGVYEWNLHTARPSFCIWVVVICSSAPHSYFMAFQKTILRLFSRQRKRNASLGKRSPWVQKCFLLDSLCCPLPSLTLYIDKFLRWSATKGTWNTCEHHKVFALVLSNGWYIQISKSSYFAQCEAAVLGISRR